MFLTDAGTFFRSDCLTRLMQTLVNEHETLAAVTARQRVMDRKMAKEVNATSLEWESDVKAKHETQSWLRWVQVFWGFGASEPVGTSHCHHHTTQSQWAHLIDTTTPR